MSYYATMNENLTFKSQNALQAFINEMNEEGYQFYINKKYPLDAESEESYIYYDNTFFENILKKYAPDIENGSSCSFIGEDSTRWRFIIDDGVCTEVNEPDTDAYIAVLKNETIIGFLQAESVSAAKKKLKEANIDFDKVSYLCTMQMLA